MLCLSTSSSSSWTEVWGVAVTTARLMKPLARLRPRPWRSALSMSRREMIPTTAPCWSRTGMPLWPCSRSEAWVSATVAWSRTVFTGEVMMSPASTTGEACRARLSSTRWAACSGSRSVLPNAAPGWPAPSMASASASALSKRSLLRANTRVLPSMRTTTSAASVALMSSRSLTSPLTPPTYSGYSNTASTTLRPATSTMREFACSAERNAICSSPSVSCAKRLTSCRLAPLASR